MKEQAERLGESTVADKKAFKEAWVKSTYAAATEARSRTKAHELRQEGGAKALFVGYPKLVENMGEQQASNYAQACRSKPGWAKWNSMGKCWFYNFVSEYSDHSQSQSFLLKEEQQMQGSVPEASLSQVPLPPSNLRRKPRKPQL